ncbi:MAG: hypothetical protein DWQ28_08020 [Proteobacteria bacterium]|nr:MAG: hypothetical protein DWQ28_08020 [Pseudomonadota bacterium]
MAKVYTGRDGVMQLAGTTLAKVVSFSLSANLETLETTTLSENIRSYTPGISGYSGSATLLYYKDENGDINTTDLLNKLYKTGTTGVSSTDTVELTFRWVDGADNNDIKLTAYVTSASIGAVTGDIVRAEIAFQGTGALSTVSIS